MVDTLHPIRCLLNLATNGGTLNCTVVEPQKMEFRMLILPCIGMAPVIRALRESWREINSKWKDIQICRGMGLKEFFEVWD